MDALVLLPGVGFGLNALVAGLVGLHVLALVRPLSARWCYGEGGGEGRATHTLGRRWQLFWLSKFVQDTTKSQQRSAIKKRL